jgi:antagonist of KipI
VLEVIEPGLLTTVQGVGRGGYNSPGIPPAAVFDNFSFRIGNLLVRNRRGGPFLIGGENSEVGLEMTLVGPRLNALDDLSIAITGAGMSPSEEKNIMCTGGIPPIREISSEPSGPNSKMLGSR